MTENKQNDQFRRILKMILSLILIIIEIVLCFVFFLLILSIGILKGFQLEYVSWPIVILGTTLILKTLKRIYPKEWNLKKRLLVTWFSAFVILSGCKIFNVLTQTSGRLEQFGHRYGHCAGTLSPLFQNPVAQFIGNQTLKMFPLWAQYLNYIFEDTCRVLNVRNATEGNEQVKQLCGPKELGECYTHIFQSGNQSFTFSSTGSILYMAQAFIKLMKIVSPEGEKKGEIIPDELHYTLMMDLIELDSTIANNMKENAKIEKLFPHIQFSSDTKFDQIEERLKTSPEKDMIKNLSKEFFNCSDSQCQNYLIVKTDQEIRSKYLKMSEDNMNKMKSSLQKKLSTDKGMELLQLPKNALIFERAKRLNLITP